MNDTLVCTTNGSGTCEVTQPQSRITFTPRFDVWETDHEYILAGDLPGVAPEDLDVSYEKQELTIYGKVTPRTGDGRMLSAEYGVGDFHRSFRLSDAIDGSAIAAELKGGVLTVRLPKREEVRPRKITVK